MFGVTKVFGGVGDAEFSLEEGDGVGDLVDFRVGFGGGGFGDGAGNLAPGKFAEDAGFTDASAVAADDGDGVGEFAVVNDLNLVEAGEHVVHIRGGGGAGGEFFS